jgi:aldose sugar dehydrogenase
MTQPRRNYRKARHSHHSTFESLEDRCVLQGDPVMLDPNLSVRPAVGELVTPIGMAFLTSNDFLVLEKNTGKVQRVVDGALHSTVLDLAVNFGTERGLLGVATHPEFPTNPSVYLYWTESTTGGDTDVLSETPFLGNRVDRFTWDGSMLTHAQNLLTLRAIQQDGAAEPPDQGDDGQPERGNHDGGILRFGPDGKLYVMVGDLGRRGQLQNLPSGPTDSGLGPTVPDDQFGGPEPDDAHLAGVVLRLNDDGTTPTDNPFFDDGADMGGEVGENIQQIFSYGIRNSFGMAFDPRSGDLWTQENGEDAYDELNRVEPGQNSGWIQIAGPVERLDEFKEIETTSLHHEDFPNLQQLRWPPENIADSSEEALSRLFVLPGSEYSDPEFSWKHVLAPAGIGFLDGNSLGKQYAGDLFVGFSTTDTLGGPLFRFNLTGNRRNIATDDPRLEDRVADNLDFHDMTESESLLIGRDFGVITDVQTGPNGNLYVVSLDQGAVYEIFRAGKENQRAAFTTRLSGDEEVPPRDTQATGKVQLKLNKDGTELDYTINVSKIENVVSAHLHLGAAGMNGDVVATLFGPVAPDGGRENGRLVRGTITAADLEGPLAGQSLSALIDRIEMGLIYVNVHTDDGTGEANTGPGDFAAGEIRGQVRLKSAPDADVVDDVFANWKRESRMLDLLTQIVESTQSGRRMH